MTTCDEIAAALHRLPVGERWSLLHQFSEELWNDWDAEIAAGRLDDLLAEARADIATRPKYVAPSRQG